MKKTVSLIISIIMGMACIVPINAQGQYADREYVISEFVQAVGKNNFEKKSGDISSFLDADNVDTAYKEDIEIAVANNIVTGYDDNTLKPENSITRAEAAVILSKCLGLVKITEPENHFADVPQWADGDIKKLTQGGIIKGYSDTIFGSKDPITVEQVSILTHRIEEKNNKYNLKDDYYGYINEKFKRNNFLGEDQLSIDNFDIVNEVVNERINEIIEDSFEGTDEDYKRILSVYNLYVNSESREKDGFTAIQPYLDAIDNVSSVKDIPGLEAFLERELGKSYLFNTNIAVNPEDSSKYILQIEESKAMLDKEFYFNLSSDKVKNAYNSFVKNALTKVGDETGAALGGKIYDFETKLIQKSGTQNLGTYYLVADSSSINNYCLKIDVKSFIDALGAKDSNKISIYNSDQFKQIGTIVADEDINVIKAYYKANLLFDYGKYLTKDIYNSVNEFDRVIYGIQPQTYEKNAVNFVKRYARNAAVNKYAEKYFDSQKEENINSMVNDIRSYYETMIKNNDWMSDETKTKAINKLEKIKIKIGYPKTAKAYDSKINIVPVENGGTLMSNIVNIDKVLSEYDLSVAGGNVNTVDWKMSPFTVNAAYIPVANEITIPMGILESPFYDENADYYENLGGIGIIIAHEISHAFDPYGAMFDENGNKNDWWTENDKNKFYDLADKVIDYFNKYSVSSGVDNNGSQTVLENVADLGGVACVVGVTKTKGGNLKTVMESFAQTWGEIADSNYLIQMSKADTHSVAKIRVNGVLSSINEFYDEYNITEGDEMYKAPSNRVGIW